MSSAQKLYQEGKITYMRTDSVNLSGQAIAAAKDYITSQFGPEYSTVRQFKTKNASAQEAHEAIRPTDMSQARGSSNDYDQKIYDLIRNRALASQMSPAKLEKTTVTINISTATEIFEAKGEVIVFAGFLKVYGAGKKDPDILPAMESGDVLALESALAKQTFARPPARYTEGSLVKKLEELGIGRPSTFATIINTIQARDYVVKGEGEGEERDVITFTVSPAQSVAREVIKEKTGSDKGKLVPTGVGEMISDFLTDHFTQVVDYSFTANVEEEFDKIATGALARNVMLEKFYTPFHKLVEGSGTIDRSAVAQATQIGIDPKSGKPISARFGRFGPMLQLGDPENKEEKLQFAPMPAGARIETVTLEQALKAFELPRLLGQTDDGKDIKANIGRFGPYIQVDKLFVSIKPIDPHDITLEQARELYIAKLKSEAEKNITDFGDGIKVLNGRYGPYITDGKKNAKIPKDQKPEEITHEQAKKMIEEAPAAGKGRFARRGAATATTKKPAAKKVTAKRKAAPKKK